MRHGLHARFQSTFRVAFAVICFSGCGFLTSCKKGPDISTPRKAAVLFAKAAEAGDLETVHQVATGTEAEFALVKDLGLERQSIEHFIAAGTEKFGDLGKFKNISLNLAEEFENSDEKIDGDTATLTAKPTADNSDPTPVLLKKDGSHWKFDLSYLDKDTSARDKWQKMPLAAKAWEEGAQDISDGKYRSFPEALGTVRSKVAVILMGEEAAKAIRDRKKSRDDISSITTALERYKVDASEYPSTADGLIALMKQPSSGVNWKGPYLDDTLPLDPWGHAYVYLAPGQHNLNAFDLYSTGPDGQDGTADDITNWNTGQ